VDEHQLEIKLKIPDAWPLHRSEVKDMKMVGVDEKKWRAWMLGVQQTIYVHRLEWSNREWVKPIQENCDATL